MTKEMFPDWKQLDFKIHWNNPGNIIEINLFIYLKFIYFLFKKFIKIKLKLFKLN